MPPVQFNTITFATEYVLRFAVGETILCLTFNLIGSANFAELSLKIKKLKVYNIDSAEIRNN